MTIRRFVQRTFGCPARWLMVTARPAGHKRGARMSMPSAECQWGQRFDLKLAAGRRPGRGRQNDTTTLQAKTYTTQRPTKFRPFPLVPWSCMWAGPFSSSSHQTGNNHRCAAAPNGLAKNWLTVAAGMPQRRSLRPSAHVCTGEKPCERKGQSSLEQEQGVAARVVHVT